MKKTWILITIAIMLAAGCSDPKQASEKNFEKTLNTYFKEQPCMATGPGANFDFPLKISGRDMFFKSYKEYLNTFVEIGFLTKEETLEEVKTQPVFFSGNVKDGKIAVITYTLTDEGKKYYRSKETPNGKKSGFYIGQPVVDKVEQFSEPADLMGLKVSQVRYTYKVEDLQDWARSDKIRATDRSINRYVKTVQQPAEEKATLILTSKGWVHENQYRQ